MDFLRSEGSGNVYGSRISQGGLSEGEYHWVFNAVTHNSAGESNDSNDVYDVPFHVDLTPPNFELSVDGQCMNPDSSVFVARFAWGDSATPDIRAMRWQLEKSDGNDFSLVTAMPSLYDVTSKDFAVAWDKVPDRENLQDGLYRVKALAIDYAAPNLEAHGFAIGLVAKIAGGNDKDSDWDVLDGYRFNRMEKSIEFRVDRTAPELNFERVGFARLCRGFERRGHFRQDVGAGVRESVLRGTSRYDSGAGRLVLRAGRSLPSAMERPPCGGYRCRKL